MKSCSTKIKNYHSSNNTQILIYKITYLSNNNRFWFSHLHASNFQLFTFSFICKMRYYYLFTRYIRFWVDDVNIFAKFQNSHLTICTLSLQEKKQNLKSWNSDTAPCTAVTCTSNDHPIPVFLPSIYPKNQDKSQSYMKRKAENE